MRESSRNNFGVIDISHKGKVIPTSVGSKMYEDTFCGLQSNTNFPNTMANIPIGYTHRPDLIANLWLGTSGFWWLLCQRNNIFDVFEQLNSQDRIYIPV